MSAITSFCLVCCGASLVGCHSLKPSNASDEQAIRSVLAAQQAAWNRGDVAGFLHAGYWNSPELVFLSGGDDTRGFQPVLERYVARYQSGDAKMGHLEFDRIEIEQLGPDAALARGRWKLDYQDRDDLSGLFSLVFRRFDAPTAAWRIIHDHTSLATP